MMGPAKGCGHMATSSGQEWCTPCAGEKGVCEFCGKALKGKKIKLPDARRKPNKKRE